MDILREFLESSTIHGLAYISTAKVSQYIQFFWWSISLYLDKASQDSMVGACMPWVHWSGNPYWQVVQGVEGVSN